MLGSLSRQQLTLYQRQWWKMLVFKQSELGGVEEARIQYGQSGLVYGGGSRYGDLDGEDQYRYPLDAEIVGAPLLVNRRSGSTAVLVRGIDYELYPGYISFKVDPFADERLTTREVYEDGDLADYEVAVWAFAGDLDKDHVWDHAGYVVGWRYATSQAYKDYVNAAWDMHSWGPTTLSLRKVIAGALGVPLAAGDETVERIFETDHLFIITDRQVYRYELGSNATVAEGDTIKEGDTLTDALQFTELFGNVQDLDDYEGIVLSDAMLKDDYLGSLYFVNDDETLTYVGVDDDGYAEVQFPVSGFPLDITTFWETVHARGKAQGITLAHMLDTRENGNGEPLAYHLPNTVNPMEIITELIGANFMLVKVRTAVTDDDAPGIHALGVMRELLPPGMGVIFYVELEADQDTYESEDVSDGVITFEYALNAPTTILDVYDATGVLYIMVDGDFVLVDDLYVVVGSGGSDVPSETYGHLVPTLRQIATDCD